ncbi:hypothetical protein HQ587_02635 [bacterium]|nr:hypothetical protein [bacterium]
METESYENDPDVIPFIKFLERGSFPDNDSGRGSESQLPEELQGLNWGALMMNFLWGLAMKVPWTWLCLIPLFGSIFPIYMWIKGNEWAWQYRRWDSVEQFRRIQMAWTIWGLILSFAVMILGLILIVWLVMLLAPIMPYLHRYFAK